MLQVALSFGIVTFLTSALKSIQLCYPPFGGCRRNGYKSVNYVALCRGLKISGE